MLGYLYDFQDQPAGGGTYGESHMFRQRVQNDNVSVDPRAVQTFKVSKGRFSNCKGGY